MELKVFIHGKDVVENVLSNARNDTHLVRVVQLALTQEVTEKARIRSEMVIAILGQRVMETSCNNASQFSENVC